MKAVGYNKPLPLTASDSLVDIDLPKPRPDGRDILVEVKAVSVDLMTIGKVVLEGFD